jgi:hypothetical protein
VIQPHLTGVADGWIEMKDGDESCRTIFDRHYSRHVYADGRTPKLFMGPGTKKPLMLADGRALFAWRKHISDDGQTGVNCAIFRNEQDDRRASDLIRQAVSLARARWWPTERFYTYVDPKKVTPVMVRGIPCFGFCFWKAGWHFVGVTKGGLFIWALEAEHGVVLPANARGGAMACDSRGRTAAGGSDAA